MRTGERTSSLSYRHQLRAAGSAQVMVFVVHRDPVARDLFGVPPLMDISPHWHVCGENSGFFMTRASRRSGPRGTPAIPHAPPSCSQQQNQGELRTRIEHRRRRRCGWLVGGSRRNGQAGSPGAGPLESSCHRLLQALALWAVNRVVRLLVCDAVLTQTWELERLSRPALVGERDAAATASLKGHRLPLSSRLAVFAARSRPQRIAPERSSARPAARMAAMLLWSSAVARKAMKRLGVLVAPRCFTGATLPRRGHRVNALSSETSHRHLVETTLVRGIAYLYLTSVVKLRPYAEGGRVWGWRLTCWS